VTLTPHPLLVSWSRKDRAIPLLPLWAGRPVQSLRCLYKGALYLYLFTTAGNSSANRGNLATQKNLLSCSCHHLQCSIKPMLQCVCKFQYGI
jgi:hypothetical protein